jgi:hypothetical protein
MEIGRFTPSSAVTAAYGRNRFNPTEDAAAAATQRGIPARNDQVTLSVPSSPPEEALAAVDHAAGVAADLYAAGKELHFGTDPDTGRVSVQLRGLDGTVHDTLTGSRALELLSGGMV